MLAYRCHGIAYHNLLQVGAKQVSEVAAACVPEVAAQIERVYRGVVERTAVRGGIGGMHKGQRRAAVCKLQCLYPAAKERIGVYLLHGGGDGEGGKGRAAIESIWLYCLHLVRNVYGLHSITAVKGIRSNGRHLVLHVRRLQRFTVVERIPSYLLYVTAEEYCFQIYAVIEGVRSYACHLIACLHVFQGSAKRCISIDVITADVVNVTPQMQGFYRTAVERAKIAAIIIIDY